MCPFPGRWLLSAFVRALLGSTAALNCHRIILLIRNYELVIRNYEIVIRNYGLVIHRRILNNNNYIDNTMWGKLLK